jgi:hypothetical protein
VWTLDQVGYLISQNLWPNPNSDQYFNYNSLLLNGDGTNGAQNNTFLDSSTNNFTITRNGNTTQGSFSPYGNLWSNYLNGSTCYLNAPSSTNFAMGSGNFTIEAWIYPTTTSAGTRVFEFSGNTYNIDINTSATGKISYYNGSSSIISSGTPITINAWQHIALVRNSGTATIYVNGVSVASSSDSGNITAAQTLYIGGVTNGWFQGYISNVRVNKGTAVYTSNFTPSTTPLTAISGTQLLTCQSNRFIDNSSNAFAITTSGTPSVQRFSPFNPTAPYSTTTIGGSGYFDGTNSSNLSIPSSSAWSFGSGNFTWEAWVYPALSSGDTGDHWVISWPTSYGSGGGSVFGLNIYNGGWRVGMFNSYEITGSATPYYNQWNHIALVRNGNTLTFYINGTSFGSISVSGVTFTANGGPYISSYASSPGGNNSWVGYLSDIRINNTALYTTTFTPPTAPETAVSGTQLLLSYQNAGIPDLAMQNDLQTVGSAQVSTSVKKYGTGSLSFDGSTSYLNQPANPVYNFGSGNFTIESWVYITSYSGGPFIFDSESNSSYGVGIQISTSGKAVFWYSTNGTTFPNITGGTTLSTGTWYHIAVVRNGSALNLYINGVSDASTTISGSISYTGYNIIGARSNLPTSVTNYFNGYLDDFRITVGLARYTANFTPPTSALPTY